MVFLYPATLAAAEEGGFLVGFPDFPEAITQGDDEGHALREAADCLEEAIAGRIVRGEVIPVPSKGRRGCHRILLPALMAAKASLYLAARHARVSKVELAKRMGCDEKEIRRLLDPRHPSKISKIEAALTMLGQALIVELRKVA